MHIEDLNQEIESCTRCRLSETRIHVLCGEGDPDAKLMLIAQAPGETEDREGKMFIGPSGKVLDELLQKANIKRENIYMTNLIKCMLPKYRRPKQDEIAMCSAFVDKEIELIKPLVIASLGYYATKYLFERYAVPLPIKPDFHTVFGKVLFIDNRKILPLQHPAAVLHDPVIKEVMIENYRKLNVILTDCSWFPSCPMKRLYEKGILDKKWIERYCKGDWGHCVRYRMEEGGEPHPDWMLPDGTIDERLHKHIAEML